MQYGVIVTTGDPQTVGELAAAAEAAGWDGVFYFDAIAIGEMELYDPWVVLARSPFGLSALGSARS